MNTTTTTPSSSSSSPSFVQVPEDMDGATGVQVMWRLNGEVKCEALVRAAEAAGLDTSILPSEPTPHVRTKRALKHAARGQDKMVLPHPKGGFAIVRKGETASRDLDLKQGLHVWWDGNRTEGKLCVSDEAHADVDTVRAAFKRYADVFVSEDFAVWLPRLLNALGAVALRESGGVYFVPAHKVAEWRAWAEVIRLVSGHTLYDDIKLLPTKGAIALVLDSIVAEADKNLKAWGKKTKSITSKRGFRSKEKEYTALAEKLASYEQLLGVRLDALKQRASAAKADVAEALLKLEGGAF